MGKTMMPLLSLALPCMIYVEKDRMVRGGPARRSNDEMQIRDQSEGTEQNNARLCTIRVWAADMEKRTYSCYESLMETLSSGTAMSAT